MVVSPHILLGRQGLLALAAGIPEEKQVRPLLPLAT